MGFFKAWQGRRVYNSSVRSGAATHFGKAVAKSIYRNMKKGMKAPFGY